MHLMKMKKFEAMPGDTGKIPGGSPGTGITVDEEIDSEESDMFASVDDDLFGEEKEKPKASTEETSGKSLPAEEALSDEDVSIPLEETVQEPIQETVSETPAPEPAPAPQPEIPPQQPVAPPVQEPQPAQAEPEPQPLDRAQARLNAMAELEKHYALSKEDADAMISEPETVLPRLASQVYLDVYESVLRDVQMMMPRAVQTITQQSQAAQKDEADFYTAWPKLKEHSQEVMRLGQMYRQMYPQATKEQFIQDVGVHAMVNLKIPIQNAQPAAQQQVPAQPAQRNVPPAPPRGGPAVTPPSTPQGSGNPFSDLADDWGNDVW